MPNAATEHTRAAHRAVADELDFTDTTDFELARRGLLAPLADDGVITDEAGNAVWDLRRFSFLAEAADLTDPADCPDTVNPSLWRQGQLLAVAGLFEVVPGIYQVRGADLSNITFIEGPDGLIVMDPLISAEPARAALELYREHRGDRPVRAVIYTHSHIDHYGGVKGVVDEEAVRSGEVAVVAPAGFTENVVDENVLAGPAMTRRASYMYGALLPAGPQGSVTTGLGLGLSMGTVTLIVPTHEVTTTGERLTLAGLELEFLMAPDTEAPSEMFFHIPALRALCTAECACRNQHNVYTLRGAKVRDARAWSTYLHDARRRWAADSDVLFAPHHWPVWGSAEIAEHLIEQAAAYRFLHDQTLRLANHGATMREAAEQVRLPASLAGRWHLRGYYGTTNHNVKAVWNKYLGWFDGNPATLHRLPEADGARRRVAYMGGADAVLERARADFEAGDYRWVAEVVNDVVRADPAHTAARLLLADALEQLGYQAESGPWRGFYLTGAQELRDGRWDLPMVDTTSPDTMRAMPTTLFFDSLAVRVDAEAAEGRHLAIGLVLTDTDEAFVVRIRHSVLELEPGLDAVDPGEALDVTVTMTRPMLEAVALGRRSFDEVTGEPGVTVDGRVEAIHELVACIGTLGSWFGLAER